MSFSALSRFVLRDGTGQAVKISYHPVPCPVPDFDRLSWPVLSLGKILSLSHCLFVPKSCTVPSCWKRYLLPWNDFGWTDGRLWLCLTTIPPPPPCFSTTHSVQWKHTVIHFMTLFCFYSSYDINSLFLTLLAEQIEQKLLCLIKRPGQIMLFRCADLADKK